MVSTTNDSLRRANRIRITVPFSLLLIVLAWEVLLFYDIPTDHIHWSIEILFFGILGPSIVYFVLSYVVRKLQLEVDITHKLEILNKTLESKVRERTESLTKRNAELAVANAELAVANAELQTLDQLKSDFVSMVSHELRGPLTTLNGGIELALDEGHKLPNESRHILEVISHESQRLTEFVQTILDVSRLDAGKFNIIAGLASISPLIDHVVDLVTAQENREITYRETTGLPMVWVDEIALEKILCNLLANAAKYSPKDQPILLDVSASKRKVDITVTDFGPGIPHEEQTLIFERFRRLESGDQLSTRGWGLGLYLAKALAKAQDCSLTVLSPVHGNLESLGTAFTISIPVSSEVSNNEQT